jgi:hypothetical protein
MAASRTGAAFAAETTKWQVRFILGIIGGKTGYGVNFTIRILGDFHQFSAKKGNFLQNQCFDNLLLHKRLYFEPKWQIFSPFFPAEMLRKS